MKLKNKHIITKGTCSVEGCSRPAEIKGMCKLCYQKDYYYKNHEKLKADQRERGRKLRSTRDKSIRKIEIPNPEDIPKEPKRKIIPVRMIQHMTPEQIAQCQFIKSWKGY